MKDFESVMRQHFKDDNEHFGKLEDKVDDLSKQTHKLQEQIIQNGDHMSHFNKNLVEVNLKVSEVQKSLLGISLELRDRYSNRELDASFNKFEKKASDNAAKISILESKEEEVGKLIFGVKMNIWVVGSIIGIVLTLIGYIFVNQTNNTKDSINELKAQVSHIR